MSKRNYSNVAPPLPLSTGVNSSAVTLQVTSTTGYPTPPFILSVGRGTASEEVMLCTGKTSTTFTVTRGYDGTSASAHAVGDMVEHTTAAIDYREAGSPPPMTTAERDALAGADLWDGRTISNTDTDTLDRYDGSTWVAMARFGDVTYGLAHHTHPIGDLPVAASGESSDAKVVRSDDSRLSNTRDPNSHTHAIGDLPVAASGESSSSKVVRANDSRLSDTRDPKTHTHDDRYYTESESDTLLSDKASASEGGAEKKANGSATTGTVNLDCATASVFTISPTGNITLNPTNVPATGISCTLTVIISQGATVRTVAMPSGTKWLGIAPVQRASRACVITMITVNGGTTWYASAGVESA
jgi:hypothetical protein